MVTDNELIAEFMGAKKGNGGTKNNPVYTGIIVSPSGVMWTSDVKGMIYHESWDWLMPVVEKINQKGYDVLINATGLQNEIHNCDVTTTTDIQAATTSKSLIDAVYKAVMQFIKWHNLNPTQP